jgi:hypothetical protein
MSQNAEIVAWVCFGFGALILLFGVVLALYLSFKKTTQDVSAKVKDAETKVEQLKDTAVAGAENPASDPGAATAAANKAGEVQSVLGEISGIVGSLPENLRFAGLLVLVGMVLMGVATVQFGGHTLF